MKLSTTKLLMAAAGTHVPPGGEREPRGRWREADGDRARSLEPAQPAPSDSRLFVSPERLALGEDWRASLIEQRVADRIAAAATEATTAAATAVRKAAAAAGGTNSTESIPCKSVYTVTYLLIHYVAQIRTFILMTMQFIVLRSCMKDTHSLEQAPQHRSHGRCRSPQRTII